MSNLDSLYWDALDHPGKTQRAGHGGAWEAVYSPASATVRVWHHDTMMLETGPDGVYVNLGWGSVSDQNGLNRILPYARPGWRYFRDAKGGGPRLEPVSEGALDGLTVSARLIGRGYYTNVVYDFKYATG